MNIKSAFRHAARKLRNWPYRTKRKLASLTRDQRKQSRIRYLQEFMDQIPHRRFFLSVESSPEPGEDKKWDGGLHREEERILVASGKEAFEVMAGIVKEACHGKRYADDWVLRGSELVVQVLPGDDTTMWHVFQCMYSSRNGESYQDVLEQARRYYEV